MPSGVLCILRPGLSLDLELVYLTSAAVLASYVGAGNLSSGPFQTKSSPQPPSPLILRRILESSVVCTLDVYPGVYMWKEQRGGPQVPPETVQRH